jgi:nodulation protein Z
VHHVVTRPYRDSNVGSNLSSLAGAVWLAQRLSRSLVVDWRGLSQLRDPELNYFTEFFATPPTLGGVPVSYAPTDVAGPYDESATVQPGEARRLALEGGRAETEPIVLQTYHGLDRLHPGPDEERRRLLRGIYEEIHPGAAVRAAVGTWWNETIRGSAVVGINVRTGNGRYFGKGMRYTQRVDVSLFENERRFVAKLERACRDRIARLPRTMRDDVAVFYATDSAVMSALLAQLPHAVTRRTVFPPSGAGDTYNFSGERHSDRDAIVDTLADMFLLARCDALVYNNSLFNQYARVVTGNFGGNLVQFESLFLSGKLRSLKAKATGAAGRVRHR